MWGRSWGPANDETGEQTSNIRVYALCEQGKLAHVRIMNAVGVEPAALAAFVATQERSR